MVSAKKWFAGQFKPDTVAFLLVLFGLGLGFFAGELSCAADCMDYDTTACDIPPEWEAAGCNPAYFNADDGCDCGCGALDPDCGGAADPADCAYCDSTACMGSCSMITADGIRMNTMSPGAS